MKFQQLYMLNIFLIIHLVVCALLVIVILLQKTGADSISGLGMSSTGRSGLVTAQTAASFLVKTTIVLAVIFMCNALFMSYLFNKENAKSLSKIEKAVDKTIPMAK